MRKGGGVNRKIVQLKIVHSFSLFFSKFTYFAILICFLKRPGFGSEGRNVTRVNVFLRFQCRNGRV